jgi:hypothetical protein
MNVIPFDKVKRDGFFFVNLPDSKARPTLVEVFGDLHFVCEMGSPESKPFSQYAHHLFCRVHVPMNCWFTGKKTWFETDDAPPVEEDLDSDD